MKDIHLIEKSALYNRVPGTKDQWTTGTWTMSPETAGSLRGGSVFLHTHQKGSCCLGGKILGCELEPTGRYTIRFEFDPDVLNITTDGRCEKNWSVEMLLEPRATV